MSGIPQLRPVMITFVLAALMPSALLGAEEPFPPIYVVDVTAPSLEALQDLVAMPYSVSHVAHNTATLYLSAQEYAEVSALGYPTQLLEIERAAPRSGDKEEAYIDYEELGPILANYEQQYPDLCRVYTLGQSVRNREIWAIKITVDPDTPADKPVVKFVSTIHGNEPVGTMFCLNFAEELLADYDSNPYIQDLLNRTVFWLVPIANPDGYYLGVRFNINVIDLNRNFPIYGKDYVDTWYESDDLGDGGREIEVSHLMRWHAQEPSTIAANLHGGALVANYPYDNDPRVLSGSEAKSPDDDLFKFISLQYSSNNPPMYSSTAFYQGIVNGSRWYSITGGMMDWHYRFLGCPEITLEISLVKNPAPAQLPQLWQDNRDSFFAYSEMAHIGIRGLCLDRNGDVPPWTKVMVSGRDQPVFSNPSFGDYHRLLLPGTYSLSFSAPGYITYFVDDITVEEGPATRVDLSLSTGDIDGSGTIDDTDIQWVVDALLGRAIPYDADVNGRGMSPTDVQAVNNRIGDNLF